MALDQRKYERKHTDVLRDIRPMYVRLGDWLTGSSNAFAVFFMAGAAIYYYPPLRSAADLILFFMLIYFWWLTLRDRSLAFKLPLGAKYKDKRNVGPGRSGKGDGILYLGNVEKTNEEVWFGNSDARTHILYLGTTGSGKTTGLKSIVSNALTWGSGFVYIDGKADTDLWSSLSSLVRRFGRDDDLLVLNYMTGNSDLKAPSNTMNPFSSGSASYLTNMLVSLMPDAEGDNAMWKERAVSLIGSLMPALTWKRDNQEIPMSVGLIRNALTLPNVVKLSRDKAVPEILRAGIRGYLDTLPGYIDAAFDDEGKEKPAGPDNPGYDTTTPRQQHGFLSMQFTRSLQSLGDDYGYIFDTQAADVDMVDVVLNRRILVVLIPALEKSADEAANLGKIVAATIKGMMGSTLGATVEGESATVIENKPTQSSTPFMCVFDEVGYYASSGMGVMAAQARSLGFSLVFSAQDLPAMEKRIKEEARSIAANCNIKLFGKLEDPTQTKEFFEKTVGSAMVMESSGFQLASNSRSTGTYYDNLQASLQLRPRASYDGLRAFKEGQAVIAFGEMVVDTTMYNSDPGMAKAMRVTRFMALPPPDDNMLKHAATITKVRDLMVHKTWTAMKADVAASTPEDIQAMADTFAHKNAIRINPSERGMAAIASVFALTNSLDSVEEASSSTIAPKPAAAPLAATRAPGTLPPVVSQQQDGGDVPPLAATRPTTGTPLKTPLFKKPPTAPETPAALPAETQAAAPQQQSSGNPMGFFSKGKTTPPAQPSETPPAAPVAEQPPAAPPVQRTTLDQDTQDILKKAGEDARKALLKEKDDIGAAE